MVKFFSNGPRIYSVDMMFSYINIYQPSYEKVKVADVMEILNYDCWGVPAKGIKYSPLDVLANLKKPKYKHEVERIEKCDLSYPIIMNGKMVVDGVHRISKAHIYNKRTINAYMFSDSIMDKFLINNAGDWDAANKIQPHEYIELFHKRFCVRGSRSKN